MNIAANLMRVVASLKTTLVSSRRGISDTVAAMIPQVVRALVGFVATILVARGLGPVGYGEYALATSFSDLVVALSDLGIGQTAVRYASRAVHQEDWQSQLAILRWGFWWRLIFTLIVVVVLFLLAPAIAAGLWHSESLTPLIRLCLVAGAFGSLAVVPTLYFQSLRRFEMIAKILVIQTMISFGGILIVALFHRWSAYTVILATIVATGVGSLVFLLSIPREIVLTLERPRPTCRAGVTAFLRGPRPVLMEEKGLDSTDPGEFAIYMLGSSVLIMIITRIDVWSQGVLLDKSDIGVYGVAMRFTLPLAIVLFSMNAALWPRISTAMSLKSIKALLGKTLRVSTLAACAGVGYAVVVPLITPGLLGQEFASSIVLVRLLSLRYSIAILTIPAGLVGYGLGMVRHYAVMNLIQLTAVVLLNIGLLPIYGPVGSAIALIVNEVIGTVFTGTFLLRNLRSLSKGSAREETAAAS